MSEIERLKAEIASLRTENKRLQFHLASDAVNASVNAVLKAENERLQLHLGRLLAAGCEAIADGYCHYCRGCIAEYGNGHEFDCPYVAATAWVAAASP